MPVEVILPKVDMDMATGKIAAWHVAEGETVEKGAPLFDIETDKAAMEVESPGSGRLHHITAAVGSEVPIGTTVAWIYAEGEDVGDAPAGAAPAEASAPAPEPTAPRATAAPAPEADGIRATPAARKLAREAGVPLSALNGTGPRGRIQRADVERAEAPTAASPVPATWASEDGALSVLRSGRGDGTPFVLIHGFAADAAGWEPLEKRLAPHAPVYRIELPNHGRSPKRRVTDFRDLTAQVRQAFDALNLDSCHLVGHSLGGAVALALADTRPRNIACLTLLCPAGLGPEINGPALTGIANATKPESLGPWLRQLTADPDAISWNFVQAAALSRSDPALRAAQADFAAALFPDGTQAFDMTAALGRLTCPTRIVWGKRDKIIPWRHALAAPGTVSLNLFDGIGHLPHVEMTDQLAELLA